MIKKLPKLFTLLVSFVCVFALGLVSCADLGSKSSNTGSIRFSIDSNRLRNAVARSVEYTGGGINKSENDEVDDLERKYTSYRFEFAIKGGFTASKSISWTYDEFHSEDNKSLSFQFDSIPEGTTLYAEATLYKIRTYEQHEGEEAKSFEEVQMKGKSETISIKSGENTLAISMYNIYFNFPFTIKINIEGCDIADSADIASILEGMCIYPFSADSKFVKAMFDAKKTNATDADIYEIANKYYDYYYPKDEEYSNLADPIAIYSSGDSKSYEISEDGTTLTVTGTLNLSVSESDHTKGEAIALLAIKSDWDSSTASPKVKYFGYLSESESITPLKSGNTVLMDAAKLHVTDTKYVLYEEGNFYLTDSPNASLAIAPKFTASSSLFTFDADGYFYCLDESEDYTKVLSENPKIGSDGKELSIESGYNIQNFTIDRATGALYVYAYKSGDYTNGISESGKLYKYTKLVSDGSVSDPVIFDCLFSGNYCFVVNDNILYRFRDNDLSKAVLPSTPDELTFSTIATITTEIPSSYSHINDILYQDDHIYILFNQSHLGFDEEPLSANAIYARGAVLDVDVEDGSIELHGWTNETADVENKYLYAFNSYTNAKGIYYFDDNGKTVNIVTSVGEMGNGFGKDVFYTPSISKNLSQTAFYNPQRFIAIKPKKLVIADDGVAFYTDAIDALRYKNANRVVSVDLRSFAMEAKDVDVEFSKKENESTLLFVACMCSGSFKSSKARRSDTKALIESLGVSYIDWDGKVQPKTITNSDSVSTFGISQ